MAGSDVEQSRDSGGPGTASGSTADTDVRRLLLDAAGACIVRRGDARIRMVDVAREAGVARSTVYRYFGSQDELLVGVLVARMDSALAMAVSRLARPDDPAASIVQLTLGATELVEANPLNVALFSPASEGLVTALELGSEDLLDVIVEHLGPLIRSWQDAGRIHGDLEVRETARWLNTIGLILLAPPWPSRSVDEKRAFLERYVLRALIP